MREPDYSPLSDLQVGEAAIVRRVNDGDANLLRYLGEIGVRPEVNLEVVDRGAQGDRVTVRVGDRVCHMGQGVAAGVFVERVSG